MLVDKKYNVSKCEHCPNCVPTMDGPTCVLLEHVSTFMGLIYPEGRTTIHPRCPLKLTQASGGK